MTTLLTILFIPIMLGTFVSLVFLIWGIVSPGKLGATLHRPVTRKLAAGTFGTMFAVLFIVSSALASALPDSSAKTTVSVAHKTVVVPRKVAVAKPQPTTPISNPTPQPKPVPQATPTAPKITGYGATLSDWNSAHIADSRFAANSSYNPTPGLGSGNANDEYYTVSSSGGRITTYSMRFASGTDISSAKSLALQEFPSDTTILWAQANTSDSTNACYQMEVHSATLASLLSTNGNVAVEFGSAGDSYNSSNVTNALFSLFDAPTAAD